MRTFLTGVLLLFLIFTGTSQQYRFERVIECENNDFELIEEPNEEQLVEKNQNHENQKIHPLSQIEQIQDEIIEGWQKEVNEDSSMNKQVRCKKWIQSYKVVQKNHLRKDEENQSAIEYKISRKPLEPLHKRGLSVNDQEIEQNLNGDEEMLKKVRGQETSIDYPDHQRQQPEELMSVFYHYSLMSNILVYQQQQPI